MKPHARAAFGQILSKLILINAQALAHRAELAAGLARLYPYRRRPLLKIEQCAQAQLQLITGLSSDSAAAMD